MKRILILLAAACSDRPLPLPEAPIASRDLGACATRGFSCGAVECCAGLFCRLLHDGPICIDQCGPQGEPCLDGRSCCSGGCHVERGGTEAICD
jgi:hypothetical protein